jgi:kinesin family protein 2/24
VPAAPDGVLCLVDLAGSETAMDIVSHSNELMKDTRDINKSLSVLKDCVRARAQVGADMNEKAKKDHYVPFRHSVLTKALKHVFDPTAGRQSKTAVIACINPSYLDAAASKNTLRYAEMLRVAVPSPKPVVYDEKAPKTWSNDQLKCWILENVRKTLILN